MTDLTIKIGRYDRAAGTVPVTFTCGAIVHARAVNAALKADGGYDKAATAARVEEVALGVRHKIEVGAITAPADPA